MARNSYLALANLGTHPAFTWVVAALRCPICREFTTSRVREYNTHFLGHDPDARTAYRWLSGREYDRQAAKRGWPVGDEALKEFGDNNL